MQYSSQRILFDISILTYNRPQLLLHTLNSLRRQTYKNFIVHLSDHGSIPPVDAKLLPKDIEIELTRYDVNARDKTTIANHHGTDVQEKILSDLRGTHFLNFADDDVLLPNALETIANLLTANPQIEILSWGNLPFNHDQNTALYNKEILRNFDNKLIHYDAFKAGIAFCSGWGIGPAVDYFYPQMAHPSAGVCSTRLLRKTKKSQGRIFVKPLGDVGFVGFLFNSPWAFFLNSPLTVVGKSKKQDSSQKFPNSRLKWQHEVRNLMNSPLKGCTFINMGVDSHLEVLNKNGIGKQWKCDLRPDFFLRHLLEIFDDEPWTQQTIRDINETIPLLIESTQRHYAITFDRAEKMVRNWIKKQIDQSSYSASADNGNMPDKVPGYASNKFENILGYVEYLAEAMKQNSRLNESIGLRLKTKAHDLVLCQH